MNKPHLKTSVLPPEREGGIDFNSFLAAINAAIAAAIVLLFFFRGPNEYINTCTICLALVFAAQNHFFLLAARRHPNPFLTLLIMHALFFYEFRVVTLLLDPYSLVLERNLFEIADMNRAFLFIILANFSIFAGVTMCSGKGFEPALLPAAPAGGVRVLLPVLLFSLAVVTKLKPELFGGFKGYVEVLLTYEVLLLLFLVFMFKYFHVFTGRQKILLFSVVLVFLVSKTLSGSRAALLTLFFCSFCAWSAVMGRLVLKKKVYLVLAALLPAAVACFILATRIRADNSSLSSMFGRMGFLDMSAEMMASSSRYRRVINFEHYFKSIVDSGLTPGFNVFNAPKAANAVSLIYRNQPEISFETLNARYQADTFTVYGEAYALFGFLAGLAGIFVASFLFQKIYRLLHDRDPFKLAALRAVFLYIFYFFFLESLGLDWFMVDLIRGVVPFFVLLYLFSIAARSVPGNTPGGDK